MPIDPTIATRVQVPRIQSPMQSIGTLYNLQRMQAQREDIEEQRRQRALENDKRIRDAADDAAMRAAMQAANGNPDDAVEALYRSGHVGPASKLMELVTKQRKDMAAAADSQLKNHAAAMKLQMSVIPGIHDEASFNAATGMINGLANSIQDPEQKKADRKSTRLNSSHIPLSRMPSSA